MARGFDYKSIFKWWVSCALKKRDVIIVSIKIRLRKTIDKYSIKIPSSIEDIKALDKKNGSKLWMGALKIEIDNV